MEGGGRVSVRRENTREERRKEKEEGELIVDGHG